MKKLTVFAIIALICACASTPAPVSAPDQLDAAIRETSDYLNKNLKAGNKLVILNIQSDFPALSEYIIDELIANTVNDRIFSVVDRQQLDTIRAEQNFQMSGEVSDESAQNIGQMLGAQIIISGAVSRIGDLYRLRVRALSVQSAQIEGQFNRNIPGGNTIAMLTQSSATGYGTAAPSSRPASVALAASAQAAPSQSAAPAQAVPAQAALPAYKIGDTGPAGGLIFYDKGNNSGGWRYLEAAPEEAEFQAVWCVNATIVENTQQTIGSGKRNTQLIVEKLKQTSGEWDTAAQQADDLVFNGFDDWFLPSQAELDQMYGNLKRRNLGDFKNEHYWSSTQIIGRSQIAYGQNFRDGQTSSDSYVSKNYVRPIRQVPGQ